MDCLASSYATYGRIQLNNPKRFNIKKLVELIRLYPDNLSFKCIRLISDDNVWECVFEYTPNDIIDCYDTLKSYIPFNIKVSLYNSEDEIFKLFVELKGIVDFFLGDDSSRLPRRINPTIVPEEVLGEMAGCYFDYKNMTLENIDKYTKILYDIEVKLTVPVFGYNTMMYFRNLLILIKRNEGKEFPEYSLETIKKIFYKFLKRFVSGNSLTLSTPLVNQLDDLFTLEEEFTTIGEVLLALGINSLTLDGDLINYFVEPLKLITKEIIDSKMASTKEINRLLTSTEIIFNGCKFQITIRIKEN